MGLPSILVYVVIVFTLGKLYNQGCCFDVNENIMKTDRSLAIRGAVWDKGNILMHRNANKRFVNKAVNWFDVLQTLINNNNEDYSKTALEDNKEGMDNIYALLKNSQDPVNRNLLPYYPLEKKQNSIDWRKVDSAEDDFVDSFIKSLSNDDRRMILKKIIDNYGEISTKETAVTPTTTVGASSSINIVSFVHPLKQVWIKATEKTPVCNCISPSVDQCLDFYPTLTHRDACMTELEMLETVSQLEKRVNKEFYPQHTVDTNLLNIFAYNTTILIFLFSIGFIIFYIYYIQPKNQPESTKSRSSKNKPYAT